MPSLLGELHSLVPALGNSFFWADPDGGLKNVCDETPESAETGPLYAAEFYNKRELEVHRGFSHAVRTRRGVVRLEQMLTVDRKHYLRSDFYNLIMRPMGYADILQLYVREHGKPLGVLQAQRGPNERDFTDTEAQRLARLAPFVAHALSGRPDSSEAATVESGESGLIITNRQGRPQGFSLQGRRLLYLATHPRLQTPGRSDLTARLPASVLKLCKDLEAIEIGETSVPPPVVRLRNPWGVFVFRAYPVDGGKGMPRQIGITVTREVPLVLRLTRGAHRLGLSRRQSEVAVLLGSGKSHRQIAEQLGISRHTVISHSRWIHAKLGVHETPALREALLEGAGSA